MFLLKMKGNRVGMRSQKLDSLSKQASIKEGNSCVRKRYNKRKEMTFILSMLKSL